MRGGEKMKRTLYLEFEDALGETFKLSVNDARDNLTGPEVSQAMDQILATNTFKSKGGDLAGSKAAYTITETRTDLI